MDADTAKLIERVRHEALHDSGNDGLLRELADALERCWGALDRIAEQQPRTLERLRIQGVVFDEAPRGDPTSWQSIAFWIYTDLCKVDLIARERA
jgi:hypothetical protein